MTRHKLTIFALIAALVALPLIAGAAEPDEEAKSILKDAEDFVKSLRATVKEMESRLKQARIEKNANKASCIESRLTDLRRLLVESKSAYKTMRQGAYDQKRAVVRQQDQTIQKNKAIAKQLAKFVDECLANLGETGGFTEALEEYLGREDDKQDDPSFANVVRVTNPEPLPPEYDPEGISPSELP
ncbi:MAG: hypothetical protein H6684_00380 [Deltaproteobacteria bacterium]|nr:hypothetical protein [bacterium]MCB9476028.1 hypothetical protein [Deltaproteobacteria bacterium]MCB9478283.1 hypothetical protein [Deltaproteobacteria bacterium]MCB9487165.1 hypothetical protein [Deltaproteobacteria bacterium]